eukprot:768074-Hanusia_phi.AAC.4
MLSVASSFALALSTNRRLFVDWEEPFVNLFEPVFEWHLSSLRERGAKKVLKLDLTANSPFLQHTCETLGCDDVISDTKSYEIVSDQYFLPLLFVNSFTRSKLLEISSTLRGCVSSNESSHAADSQDTSLSDESLVLSMISRWLFRPVKKVRRAVEMFETQQGEGGCDVGLHLRIPMFEFEYKQVTLLSQSQAVLTRSFRSLRSARR